MFLDATYCKARVTGRVVSRAVVIATGVSADGRREVLGCAVGDSETEALWTECLRDLRDRGLHGVQLVISYSHRGLLNAVGTVLRGAAWESAGCTSRPEQPSHPLLVLGDGAVGLGVAALQPARRHRSGAAVPQAHHIDRIEVTRSNDPVGVCVDEVEARRGAEVPEQPRFGVLSG